MSRALGLPEVVQQVGADTSRYIQEYRAARAETAALIADNQQLLKTVAEVQAVMGRGPAAAGPGAAAAADVAKVNAAIREQLPVLGDHGRAIADVTAAGRQFGTVQAEINQMVSQVGGTVRDTTAAVRDFRAAQAEVVRAGGDTKAVLGDLAGGFDRVRVAGGDAGDAVVANLVRVRAAADDATSALARGAAASENFMSGFQTATGRFISGDAIQSALATGAAAAARYEGAGAGGGATDAVIPGHGGQGGRQCPRRRRRRRGRRCRRLSWALPPALSARRTSSARRWPR